MLLACAIRWTTAEVFKARATSILYNTHQTVDRIDGRDLLTRARNLNPYDAELPLYQAYYARHSPKTANDHAGPPVINTSPIDNFYREALAIRPHSGHLWAQYARAQFERSQDLTETLITLEKAMTFAPYQPAIIITAMQIGLPHWNHLNQRQKLRLSDAIDFLVNQNSRRVIKMSIAHKLTKELRPRLKQPKHIERLEQALMKIEKRDMARK